jgi:CRISPR-associated exonuclease Cas4
VRSLPIWSDVIGLHGLCDVVELDIDGAPTPVEQKSGGYRPGGPADVQVAAQVLCLREMFDRPVPVGIVLSGKDRRRHEVAVDDRLGRRVVEATGAMRQLLDDGRLPRR